MAHNSNQFTVYLIGIMLILVINCTAQNGDGGGGSGKILETVTVNTVIPVEVHGSSVLFNGIDSLYIIGGYDDIIDEVPTGQVYQYNITADRIQVHGQFAHVSHGAAVLQPKGADGIIYYFGGQNDHEFWSGR